MKKLLLLTAILIQVSFGQYRILSPLYLKKSNADTITARFLVNAITQARNFSVRDASGILLLDGDTASVLASKTFVDNKYTPMSRTITIAANTMLSSSAGAQNLYANRSWTISADTLTRGLSFATDNDRILDSLRFKDSIATHRTELNLHKDTLLSHNNRINAAIQRAQDTLNIKKDKSDTTSATGYARNWDTPSIVESNTFSSGTTQTMGLLELDTLQAKSAGKVIRVIDTLKANVPIVVNHVNGLTLGNIGSQQRLQWNPSGNSYFSFHDSSNALTDLQIGDLQAAKIGIFSDTVRVSNDITIGSNNTAGIVIFGTDYTVRSGISQIGENGNNMQYSTPAAHQFLTDNDANGLGFFAIYADGSTNNFMLFIIDSSNSTFRLKAYNKDLNLLSLERFGTATDLMTVDTNGNVTRFVNTAMSADGLVSTPDTIVWTGRATSITSQNFANTATGHFYKVSYYLNTTTTGTGTVLVSFAWNDGTAKTSSSATADLTSTTNTGLATGDQIIYVASGTPSWTTTVDGGGSTEQYALRMVLTRMY